MSKYVTKPYIFCLMCFKVKSKISKRQFYVFEPKSIGTTKHNNDVESYLIDPTSIVILLL